MPVGLVDERAWASSYDSPSFECALTLLFECSVSCIPSMTLRGRFRSRSRSSPFGMRGTVVVVVEGFMFRMLGDKPMAAGNDDDVDDDVVVTDSMEAAAAEEEEREVGVAVGLLLVD